ncbi:MAG TPA: hypothetical protein VJ725_14630 [Thermoanaerobaculia bacterium]|nr:hypothetical protein [Thermoanaerobaculia bacterium]
MKRNLKALSLIVLALALGSCRERTDRQEGSVILTVADFLGLPSTVSLSDGGPFVINQITLRNVPKDVNTLPSSLQSVELRSYEVRYTRKDAGTRVPPPTVQGFFGVVRPNVDETYFNLPFLFSDQVLSPPLRDLRDFGVDRETGTTVVVLDVSIRFFGETLSGDDVATEPARFTIDVTQ